MPSSPHWPRHHETSMTPPIQIQPTSQETPSLWCLGPCAGQCRYHRWYNFTILTKSAIWSQDGPRRNGNPSMHVQHCTTFHFHCCSPCLRSCMRGFLLPARGLLTFTKSSQNDLSKTFALGMSLDFTNCAAPTPKWMGLIWSNLTHSCLILSWLSQHKLKLTQLNNFGKDICSSLCGLHSSTLLEIVSRFGRPHRHPSQ